MALELTHEAGQIQPSKKGKEGHWSPREVQMQRPLVEEHRMFNKWGGVQES